MIKIEHLRKEYPEATPLKDVCTDIQDGDIISVIGPSGTGKSTLLRCINMLERPTSGHIIVDGQDITDPSCDLCAVRQKMGMVFQSFNLFGHLTVIENIMAAPMDLKGMSKPEAYREAMRLLGLVGLSERGLRYPEELSGGQKQRVAIARTLAMDPDIILLDEPTSALDPTMVGEVQSVIRKLAEMGKTMMIVTHEMSFARAICTRVFYMDEGGIYEEGTPEQIFDNPQREKTRQFIRQLKVLELSITTPAYDLYGMQSSIAEYGSKNQLTPHLIGHLQLAFEELVQNLLLPYLTDPHIHVVIEYSAAEETATLTACYGPQFFDPLTQPGSLSLHVLRSISKQMLYSTTDNETCVNQIEIIL